MSLTVATKSFLKLPAEIRNEVYAYYIDKTSVDYVRNWRFFSRRGCLPLAQTCKQIHQEFISFFRSQTPVRTQLSLLNRYLRTYYPLGNNRSRGAALLHLILPNNADRSEPVVPYTDITHLFVLMARNAHFTCTFEQASANNEQAVAESQELQDLLRDVSQAAKPMLDSIFSVRLVMAKEGNFWNPTIKATKHRRPVVWFVFKEHATLPGEWPWYGAHDLNHESLLLWKQRLVQNGTTGLRRWYVHATARRARDAGFEPTTISVDGYELEVVSSEGEVIRLPWISTLSL